jgi:hypothetical protein
MDRLTPEALARLVDNDPTPEEVEALAADTALAAELEALREMTDALGALPDVRPPRGDWEALEARLVSEGLVQGRGGFGPRRSVSLPAWMQIAAAMVLFLAGTGVGAGFREADNTAAGGSPVTGDLSALTRVAQEARTLDEAAEVLRLAEQPYHAALTRYQQLSDQARGGRMEEDPAVRMAALEAVLAASQAAIRQAPGDVFLNGILVSAAAEREVQLRRMSASRESWF